MEGKDFKNATPSEDQSHISMEISLKIKFALNEATTM